MRKIEPAALRARALRAIANLHATTTDLRWIADHANTIAQRANAELDEGLRARRYDGDGRGGGELTGPESHLDRQLLVGTDGRWIRDRHGNPVLRDDPLVEQITRLLGTVSLAHDAASATRTIAGQIITSTDLNDRAQQATNARPIGGRGKCENCGRWCEGTRNDRLVTPTTSDANRAGAIAQCPPCLVYWKRHLELRPPKLWNVDPEPGELVNTDPPTDPRPA